jgi:DNA-directed RNA polymerase specialized sigma24 family protein
MLRATIKKGHIAWEQELVAGMRRDEPDAYREFFECFRPLLLAEARRRGVQPALCQEMVDECLDDVAMRLRRYTTPVPRSLVPYLVRALRIHRLALRRSERRRASGEHDGEMADGEPGARLIGSLSQAAVRASAGPDGERTPASSAVERLASMIEEGLTEEEELILSWVSGWVPQSHIAEWLGITHGAARNRVMRLRARLKEVALQHAATFTGREHAELADFFRRAFATTRNGDRTWTESSETRVAGAARRTSNSREDP